MGIITSTMKKIGKGIMVVPVAIAFFVGDAFGAWGDGTPKRTAVKEDEETSEDDVYDDKNVE